MSQLGVYLTAAAVVLALAGGGLLLIVRIARQRGRAEAERDQARRAVGRARRANEIDEDVHRTSDADLDRELFGR